MTLLEIEIIMHYHVHPNDYRDGDFSAEAVKEAIEKFVKNQILILGKNRKYMLSSGGQMIVDQLHRIEMPTCVWETDSERIRRIALETAKRTINPWDKYTSPAIYPNTPMWIVTPKTYLG